MASMGLRGHVTRPPNFMTLDEPVSSRVKWDIYIFLGKVMGTPRVRVYGGWEEKGEWEDPEGGVVLSYCSQI